MKTVFIFRAGASRSAGGKLMSDILLKQNTNYDTIMFPMPKLNLQIYSKESPNFNLYIPRHTFSHSPFCCARRLMICYASMN